MKNFVGLNLSTVFKNLSIPIYLTIYFLRIFGVLCRPKIDSGHNECHLFVELDPEQPAIAIQIL
ncbi:hypothetical protein BpHYR1_044998 [Brachionus plicatilis]|uniref:Uncharacterized protein n=1 Tax=Brachionus plicatilis TaxID=10195 RepID=A0A3M7QW73_BRAPC|nr:hypothetical protein BpHYR1_044998 [Brachionus plicatilis]